MQTVKHAVICVGGMGSRLGLNMPKCLVEVDGRKIIDYQLDLLTDIEDVRLVVGFMEREVIEHVRNIRDDVIFVRNPDYQTTTNSYGVNLGSRDLKEPFITIDGDLIIDPEDFKNFLRECQKGESILGVTKSKTEEAVFVELDRENRVVVFKLKSRTKYEWSGPAYHVNMPISHNGGFIYREIEKHLPLRSFKINCHEVDTPQDLVGAHKFVKKLKKDGKLK